MTQARKINVAIVGAGIGREHLSGYLALPARYVVRRLCDLDQTRAAEVLAAEPGDTAAITITDDLDAVLRDPAIDLVDVCLPPHLHVPVATAAMRAGKHVVCEKPLAPSLAEVDALAKVAEETGRFLSPVFQYRFGIAMDQIRALAAAGLTGAPHVASLETHWNRGADYYDTPWRGTWAGENGGAVLGHAIHNHDLLTAILGPVARLSAHVTTRVNPIETEDCAAISFEMANGALATSSITLGAASDTSRLRIVFEKLTAESGDAPYAPVAESWRFTARDPADQAQVDAVLADVAAPHTGFAGYFEALADALTAPAGAADTPGPHRAITLADGRRSIELVGAIYASARSGQAVALPLGEDSPVYTGWAPETAPTPAPKPAPKTPPSTDKRSRS